jgi:hypothetical protein
MLCEEVHYQYRAAIAAMIWFRNQEALSLEADALLWPVAEMVNNQFDTGVFHGVQD